MNEKEILEREIKLLQSLPYVTAYTGELKKIKQSSYIDMFEITKKINENRIKIEEIMKYKQKYKQR